MRCNRSFITFCSVTCAFHVPFATSLQAKWERVQGSSSVIQPRRSGHASFVVNGVPFVFGGYAEEGDTSNPAEIKRFVTNDLWKWQEHAWSSVSVTGEPPQSRLVAAASVLASNAYIFGGWDPQTQGTGGVILDDVHEFDPNSNSWRALDCKLPDGPTSRHIAVALPEKKSILLHTHRCQDFILIFDPSGLPYFKKQLTTGTCPSSRGLHAATCLGQSKVLLFGGAAQDGAMSNEVFILDTLTWTWEKLSLKGKEAPSPRAAPCLVSLDENHALLFGGAEMSSSGLVPRGDLWLLDVKGCKFELLLPENSSGAPAPRNAATLVPCGRGDFMLVGGWAPFRKTHDDCFILHVEE